MIIITSVDVTGVIVAIIMSNFYSTSSLID